MGLINLPSALHMLVYYFHSLSSLNPLNKCCYQINKTRCLLARLLILYGLLSLEFVNKEGLVVDKDEEES